MESALMISPPYLSAISSANFDLPVPVAPHTTITGTRFKNLVALAIPAAAIFEYGINNKQVTNDERLGHHPTTTSNAITLYRMACQSLSSRSLNNFMWRIRPSHPKSCENEANNSWFSSSLWDEGKSPFSC